MKPTIHPTLSLPDWQLAYLATMIPLQDGTSGLDHGQNVSPTGPMGCLPGSGSGSGQYVAMTQTSPEPQIMRLSERIDQLWSHPELVVSTSGRPMEEQEPRLALWDSRSTRTVAWPESSPTTKRAALMRKRVEQAWRFTWLSVGVRSCSLVCFLTVGSGGAGVKKKRNTNRKRNTNKREHKPKKGTRKKQPKLNSKGDTNK